MITWQTLWVALLVPACVAYAAWKLMPNAGRRSIALRLAGGSALPRGLRRWAEKTAKRASSGCGCDGCDKAAPPARAAAGVVSKPIVLHRRLPAAGEVPLGLGRSPDAKVAKGREGCQEERPEFEAR